MSEAAWVFYGGLVFGWLLCKLNDWRKRASSTDEAEYQAFLRNERKAQRQVCQHGHPNQDKD
jgi:hypothetical protein